MYVEALLPMERLSLACLKRLHVLHVRQAFPQPFLFNPEWPFLCCIILSQVNEVTFKTIMVFNHSPSVVLYSHFWKTGGKLFLLKLPQNCILMCGGWLDGLVWQMRAWCLVAFLIFSDKLQGCLLRWWEQLFWGHGCTHKCHRTNTNDGLGVLLVVVNEARVIILWREPFYCRHFWWLLGRKWEKIIIPRISGQSQN